MAMQDSNIICFHQDDLGTSVCVLAVNGYGEGDYDTASEPSGISVQVRSMIGDERDLPATVRGDRSWREAVGGACICCSLCCSPLGYASVASPVTYRLLKHRLSVSLADNTTTARVSDCASFLARELIRYAEAKAIFTFIIAVESQDGKTNMATRSLLLRLVSWDTTLSTRFESKDNQRLHWEPVAKIVYEETWDKSRSGNGSDVTTWVWGGVDLCCTPQKANDKSDDITSNDPATGGEGLVPRKVSSVRLQLPHDEWLEVRKALIEGSRMFPKAVADATILAKLGRFGIASNNLGLTAIPLYH